MKVGIYLRCSTEAHERATLEVQKEQCINYCKRNDWNQYEIYSDDGVSGATQDRPEFQRLLRDLESGEVSTMLVWRLDRFSRNIRDAVNIIEDLKKWNCSFVSVCDSIDLTTPSGELQFNTLLSVAQFERRLTAERTVQAKKKLLRDGFLPQGKLPLGYDYVSKSKAAKKGKPPGAHINEKEAEWVRTIFKLWNEGLTQIEIATRMEAFGFKTRQNEISRILRRECYYSGRYFLTIHGQKGRIEVPPIIDSTTWDLAQQTLASHINYGRPKYKFLFKGKIRCGACDKNLRISNINSKWGFFAYYEHRCSNGRQIYIPAEKVDEYIWDRIVGMLGGDLTPLKRTLAALKDKNTEKEIRNIELTIGGYQEQLKKIRKKKNNLIELIAETDNKILHKNYQEKILEYEDEIHRIELAARKQQEKIDQKRYLMKLAQDTDLLSKIKKFRIGKKFTFEEKKEYIDKLYGPRTIHFWPEWFLEEAEKNPELARNTPWDLGRLWADTKEVRPYYDSIKPLKGYLICEGLIQLDIEDNIFEETSIIEEGSTDHLSVKIPPW